MLGSPDRGDNNIKQAAAHEQAGAGVGEIKRVQRVFGHGTRKLRLGCGRDPLNCGKAE